MSVSNQPTNADSTAFITALQNDVASFASAKGIEAELETMRRVTQEIFGDNYRVTVEEDAEIDDDMHLVFSVEAEGDVSSVLANEDQWHERCFTLAPKAGPFVRLLVDLV